MSKLRVVDKETGEIHYVTPEELARRAPRRERRATRHRFPPIPDDVDRNTTIKLIRDALKKRSGKSWSVTGGSGTSWGWIRIDAPPARRIYDADGEPTGRGPDSGYMSPREREELGQLLGLGERVSHQGESIPASSNHRREYIMRARGQEPTVRGEQYWD